MNMRIRMQYPLSFFMQTLAQLVMEGGEMLAVILIVDRFDTLDRWTGGDLYFFFGMMSVTFYLTEFLGRGVTGTFPSIVRSGQLDTLLLRPRGVLTQVLCSDADPRRIVCIAVGIAALCMGSAASHVRWTFLKALAMGEAILAGMMLILGLFFDRGGVLHIQRQIGGAGQCADLRRPQRLPVSGGYLSEAAENIVYRRRTFCADPPDGGGLRPG